MIHLISCIDKNNAIGYKGKLLCKLPNDMKHFKNLTMGNFCVMGKRTYQELEKPLEGRTTLVLSRDTTYEAHPEVFIYDSVSDIMREYREYNEEKSDVFVCGGHNVYKEFMPHAHYIHLTIVHHEFEKADAYFPAFELSEWQVVSSIFQPADEKNKYDHSFVTYKRK